MKKLNFDIIEYINIAWRKDLEIYQNKYNEILL